MSDESLPPLANVKTVAGQVNVSSRTLRDMMADSAAIQDTIHNAILDDLRRSARQYAPEGSPDRIAWEAEQAAAAAERAAQAVIDAKPWNRARRWTRQRFHAARRRVINLLLTDNEQITDQDDW